MPKHDHLPRLPESYYQGHSVVHWIMTTAGRCTGWLNEILHARFRELMLHTASRHEIFCPVYCLMPDHLHFIWVGMRNHSNQLNAMRFFKRQLHATTPSLTLQKQSYDNVLREKDREKNAFQGTCFYILENPVRAGIVEKSSQWPFSGALVPGYPDISPHKTGFWDLFWRLYAAKRMAEGSGTETLVPATPSPGRLQPDSHSRRPT